MDHSNACWLACSIVLGHRGFAMMENDTILLKGTLLNSYHMRCGLCVKKDMLVQTGSLLELFKGSCLPGGGGGTL